MTDFQSKLNPNEKAEIDQNLIKSMKEQGGAKTTKDVFEALEETGKSNPELQELGQELIKKILEAESKLSG